MEAPRPLPGFSPVGLVEAVEVDIRVDLPAPFSPTDPVDRRGPHLACSPSLLAWTRPKLLLTPTSSMAESRVRMPWAGLNANASRRITSVAITLTPQGRTKSAN